MYFNVIPYPVTTYGHRYATNTKYCAEAHLYLSPPPVRNLLLSISISRDCTSFCSVCSSRSRWTLRLAALTRVHSSSASSSCLFSAFTLVLALSTWLNSNINLLPLGRLSEHISKRVFTFTKSKALNIYRPRTKYDGRYCFHRRVLLTLSTGGVCVTDGGGGGGDWEGEGVCDQGGYDQTTTPPDTPGYGHPTGMHSC